MFRHNIPVGRILGIPIFLDYSWFLIFGLFTWFLAVGYYPQTFRDWTAGEYWVMGAVTSAALFASVLLHELGHSVVALRYRIPVRSITLFIFGGVAQIGSEPPRASAEFWIAIAGPIVSFCLAVAARLLEPVFAPFSPLFALVSYLAMLNGALALFNLIPGFPLDGGRILRAAVWAVTHNFSRATLIAANAGRFFAYLFIFLGVWQVFVGNLINGLWIAFIGWFLESAAASQVQHQVLHGALEGHKVSEMMTPGVTTIPGSMTIDQVVHHYILEGGERNFLVESSGGVAGVLTLGAIKRIPQAEWATSRADQVMLPASGMKAVQPGTEIWRVLEEMERNGLEMIPVVTNGHLEGILTRESIGGYLRILKELGVS